jgi:hypothetical protein
MVRILFLLLIDGISPPQRNTIFITALILIPGNHEAAYLWEP